MNEDEKGYNGFSHQFEWKPNDHSMHPYTYSWSEEISKALSDSNTYQLQDWDDAYFDLQDALIDMMPSYPDAEEIINKIRNNIK